MPLTPNKHKGACYHFSMHLAHVGMGYDLHASVTSISSLYTYPPAHSSLAGCNIDWASRPRFLAT